MQNRYESTDKKGRDIIIAHFGSKIDFKESAISDRYDLETFSLEKGRSLIEIKYRPTTNSADWECDILEYEKLEALKREDPKAQHLYFMLFQNKVGRYYNLNEISISDVQIDIKNCPVSYVENKGRIDKLMINLPAKLAKTFQWS